MSANLQLPSVWSPKQRRNVMGGRVSDIYLSHWNRNQPHLLVAFHLLADGRPNPTSRLTIHPDVLQREFEPALALTGGQS